MRMKCGCQFQISFSCAHKLCQSFLPSPQHITFHCITSNKFRFKWWLKHWVSNWHDRSSAMHSSWLEANWYTMMTVRLISHQIESVVYICDRWNNVEINLDPNSVNGLSVQSIHFYVIFFISQLNAHAEKPWDKSDWQCWPKTRRLIHHLPLNWYAIYICVLFLVIVIGKTSSKRKWPSYGGQMEKNRSSDKSNDYDVFGMCARALCSCASICIYVDYLIWVFQCLRSCTRLDCTFQ